MIELALIGLLEYTTLFTIYRESKYNRSVYHQAQSLIQWRPDSYEPAHMDRYWHVVNGPLPAITLYGDPVESSFPDIG